MIQIGDFVRSYSGNIIQIDEHRAETMQHFPKLNAFSIGEMVSCCNGTGYIQNIYFKEGKFLYDIAYITPEYDIKEEEYNIKEEDLLFKQTSLSSPISSNTEEYLAGDIVRIKSLYRLKKEFGVDAEGDVLTPNCNFVRKMFKYSGSLMQIEMSEDVNTFESHAPFSIFIFTPEMFMKRVNKFRINDEVLAYSYKRKQYVVAHIKKIKLNLSTQKVEYLIETVARNGGYAWEEEESLIKFRDYKINIIEAYLKYFPIAESPYFPNLIFRKHFFSENIYTIEYDLCYRKTLYAKVIIEIDESHGTTKISIVNIGKDGRSCAVLRGKSKCNPEDKYNEILGIFFASRNISTIKKKKSKFPSFKEEHPQTWDDMVAEMKQWINENYSNYPYITYEEKLFNNLVEEIAKIIQKDLLILDSYKENLIREINLLYSSKEISPDKKILLLIMIRDLIISFRIKK